MKKRFEEPELELIESEDIITASDPDDEYGTDIF